MLGKITKHLESMTGLQLLGWSAFLMFASLPFQGEYKPPKAKAAHDQLEAGAVFCTTVAKVKLYETRQVNSGCMVSAQNFDISLSGGAYGYPGFKHPSGQQYFTKSINILYRR